MRFYRNEEIELLAEKRLLDLEREIAAPLSPPIPIDLLAERVLGLHFLWEDIEELPGEVILAGLIPEEHLIVLNERRKGLFIQKQGLERSTKGHEMGHWDLYVDKGTINHPVLFEEQSPFVLRRSPVGNVAVLKATLLSEEGREILRQIKARSDDPDEARAVNRYAAAISLPRKLIREEAAKVERTRWPNLYRLAERFDVTISALAVRLQQLDLLYVDEKGTLYGSRHAAFGQMQLGF